MPSEIAVPVVPTRICRLFGRFSLYNSPFPAHDRGAAIDLYPDRTATGATVPSPVAGEVIETFATRAPTDDRAADDDHLVVVDATGWAEGYVARLLHVDPTVSAGDRLAVGDPLGSLVRSGFFAPWVENHVHLGLRPPDANHRRATGSTRLAVEPAVRPVPWDGRGRVRRVADTYVELDAPAHPDPRTVATLAGRIDGRPVPLDGGLTHYDSGGVLDGDRDADARPVTLFGDRIGTARGRDVTWAAATITVDGTPVTGLSLSAGRQRIGLRVVCPDLSFAVGDAIAVGVAPA